MHAECLEVGVIGLPRAGPVSAPDRGILSWVNPYRGELDGFGMAVQERDVNEAAVPGKRDGHIVLRAVEGAVGRRASPAGEVVLELGLVRGVVIRIGQVRRVVAAGCKPAGVL